jgi:hypothetical protein
MRNQSTPNMSEFHQDFRVENGVMHVRLSGTLPASAIGQRTNAFQPLIDACAAQNCNKALVDARDLHVQFNTVDLYHAGKDAASLANLHLRTALVAREDMLNTFFEDVVFNRGGSLRVFTSTEAALAWLQNERQAQDPTA